MLGWFTIANPILDIIGGNNIEPLPKPLQIAMKLVVLQQERMTNLVNETFNRFRRGGAITGKCVAADVFRLLL